MSDSQAQAQAEARAKAARDRAQRRAQDADRVMVQPATFLCSAPLFTPPRCSSVQSILPARLDPDAASANRSSHLIQHSHAAIDIMRIQWREESEDDEMDGDESMRMDRCPLSLHLESERHQPLLGRIQSMAILPRYVTGGSAAQSDRCDRLLVCSDSGLLTLLAYAPIPSAPSRRRLTSLAHLRIGTQGGSAGLGRRQLGHYLRVADRGQAIAVASMEAQSGLELKEPTPDESEHGVQWWARGDGGILVYPVRDALGQTQPQPQVSTPASKSAVPSFPDVAPPISIPDIVGIITALQFLPSDPRRPDLIRMVVAVMPSEGIDPSPAALANPPQRVARRPQQLLIVDIDLVKGIATTRAFTTLPLQPNELILDIVSVDPRPAPPPDPVREATASTSSPAIPCFILLQLETRVMLVDINAASTLIFPVPIPLPPWIDARGEQRLNRVVSPRPLITAWNWVRDRRLLCVTENGEVHWLRFWWNRLAEAMRHEPASSDSTPASDAAASEWMRFLPLGIATPSKTMTTLSTPTFHSTHASVLHSASAPPPATDFLILPGEASEGMVARIDWRGIEARLMAEEEYRRAREQSMQLDSSSMTHDTLAPDALSMLKDMPMESALHRQMHLSNMSPLFDFVCFDAFAPQSASASSSIHASLPSPASPASPTSSPSSAVHAHLPVFACTGLGSGGCIRVLRRHTLRAESVSSYDISVSGSADEHKLFRALFGLKTYEQRHQSHHSFIPAHSHSSATPSTPSLSSRYFALVCSFVGSTRIQALIDGALEDVSERFGGDRGGMDLDRTTLAASIMINHAGQSLALLQVCDNGGRAIAVSGVGTDSFTGTGLLASWSPETDLVPKVEPTPASASTPHNVITIAHTFDRFILLSIPSRNLIVLLELQPDTQSTSGARFVTVAQRSVDADVSCMFVTSTNGIELGCKTNDLLIFVATHRCMLHIFTVPRMNAQSTAAAPSPAAQFDQLHACKVQSFLPNTNQDDVTCIPESIIVCAAAPSSTAASTSASASSSPSSSSSTSLLPSRHDVFLGLRNGQLLRLRFYPRAKIATTMLSNPFLKRMGNAPLKLMRMEHAAAGLVGNGIGASNSKKAYILALSERAYMLESSLTPDIGSDARAHIVGVREIVWRWGDPTSTCLQFVAPFSSDVDGAPTSCRVACIIDRSSFHLLDVDPSTPSSSNERLVETEGTPRKMVHHAPTNSLVVLTCDQTPRGIRSSVLLICPRTGNILARHHFDKRSTSVGAAASSSSSSMSMGGAGNEAAHCIATWEHASGHTLILVGTGLYPRDAKLSTKARVFCFGIAGASATELLTSPSSTGAPSSMDLGDNLAAASPPASSSIRPSSSSSLRLHCLGILETVNANVTGACTALCGLTSDLLLMVLGSQLYLVRLSVASVKQGFERATATATVASSQTGRTRFFQPRAAHSIGYPVSHMAKIRPINPPPSPSQQVQSDAADLGGMLASSLGTHHFTLTDAKRGLCVMSCTVHSETKVDFKLDYTDPFSRASRQAIMYETEGKVIPARLDATAPVLSLATLELIKRPPSPPPSVASGVKDMPVSVASRSSTGRYVSCARSITFDVFGRIFVLRRDPQPKRAPQSGSTVTGSTQQQSSSSSSGSGSAAAKLPDNVIRGSLVQESVFQLPSYPARIYTLPSSAPSLSPAFLVATLDGSIHCIRQVEDQTATWLTHIQTRLALFPSTRSMLGHHHASYRGDATGSLRSDEVMLDGELLEAWFLLDQRTQHQMIQGCEALAGVPLSKINAMLEDVLNTW